MNQSSHTTTERTSHRQTSRLLVAVTTFTIVGATVSLYQTASHSLANAQSVFSGLPKHSEEVPVTGSETTGSSAFATQPAPPTQAPTPTAEPVAAPATQAPTPAQPAPATPAAPAHDHAPASQPAHPAATVASEPMTEAAVAVAATTEGKQSTEIITGLIHKVVREDPTTTGAPVTEQAAVQHGNTLMQLPDALTDAVQAGKVATVQRVTDPTAQTVTTTVLAQEDQPGTAGAATLSAGTLAGVKQVRDVTIVLAAPAGFSPDDTTPAEVQSLVQGTVADFWARQTDNAAQFRVTRAVNWVSSDVSCSSAFAFWEDVAAKAGWSPTNDTHMLVYLPKAAAATCGVGLGTVDSAAGASLAYVAGPLRADVITHEFGHNLGLGHANSLKCATSTDGTYTNNAWNTECAAHSYGDYSDVMGISHGRIGTLSAVNQYLLGVRQDGHTVVTSSQNVTLTAAHADSGQRSAIVSAANGNLYFLEYREAADENSWLTSRGINPGVQIRRINPADKRGSIVLDASPTGKRDDQAVSLEAGAAVQVADGDVTIGVITAANGTATVQVTLGSETPVQEKHSAPRTGTKESVVMTPTAPKNQVTNGIARKNATPITPTSNQ